MIFTRANFSSFRIRTSILRHIVSNWTTTPGIRNTILRAIPQSCKMDIHSSNFPPFPQSWKLPPGAIKLSPWVGTSDASVQDACAGVFYVCTGVKGSCGNYFLRRRNFSPAHVKSSADAKIASADAKDVSLDAKSVSADAKTPSPKGKRPEGKSSIPKQKGFEKQNSTQNFNPTIVTLLWLAVKATNDVPDFRVHTRQAICRRIAF